METEIALSTGQILVRLLIVLVLVLANAFFVAAEFALVGARRTRIQALARAGNTRARLADQAIRRLDHYISGTQLGITLASLGLGWVGEATVATFIIQIFAGLPAPYNTIATHAVAGAVAFAVITFLHIVLGELAPKSVALIFPEGMSMWTAGPLIAFSKLFSPFIALLNGSANLLLRAFGLRPASEIERVHRPEEIEILLTQSYQHGLLREEPVEMIRGVFDLSETTAAEVMTPRTDIVAIPKGSTIEAAAATILEEGHSRILVYDESLDRILGVLNAREVWRAQREGVQLIDPLIRPVPFVPDSKSVEELLREMQEERVRLVVVVDEFGGTAGLVTMEDLVEEIVGDISDEFEAGPPDIEETESGVVRLSGTVPIAEVNERYALGLPEDEFTTVAGYVMGQLGRIAHTGDEVRFPTGTLRVTAMDGRRIDRLALTLQAPSALPGQEEK